MSLSLLLPGTNVWTFPLALSSTSAVGSQASGKGKGGFRIGRGLPFVYRSRSSENLELVCGLSRKSQTLKKGLTFVD
jgi:hypothetical protein